MYTPPNTRVPSSLHKVESNSRLTTNFNAADLLSGLSLIPPPTATNTAKSDDRLPEKEQENPPTSSASGIIPPPPMPLSSRISVSSSRPAGQLRSRYVLPPQLSQSSSLASTLSMTENLTEPTTPTSQMEPALSTMTVLPTPSYFDCSSSTQSSQEKQSSAEVTVPKVSYEPAKAHWFYSTKTVAHGVIWWPFDILDAQRLEAAAASANLLYVDALPTDAPNTAVPVRGGLYDVLLRDRVYKPVYWPADEEEAGEVRRVMWLYRPQNEQRVLPFSETLSKTLEEHYRRALETNIWGGRFSLPSEDVPHETDTYIFHNEKAMLQYRGSGSKSSASFAECAYLHRGLREDLAAQLPQGDDRSIEHVVFVVHGIGPIYNMRGEGLISCVNDMRRTATTLLSTHFKGVREKGRVEFLPVRWHSALHSESTGLNNRLKRVTLRSIPKMRSYTNETLTDILFYTSPKYCQHIIDTVASTINHLRQLFLQRNPDFRGDFSIAGHSLGSVIVFDLLSHQRRTPSGTPSLKSNGGGGGPDDEDDWSLLDAAAASSASVAVPTLSLNSTDLATQLTSTTDLTEAQVRQVISILIASGGGGSAATPVATHSNGVDLPVITYPQLGFPLNTCFLLGSPLSIFLVARGVERLPLEFRLPTCRACVNIFHPFDPVAYRLENMILPDYRPCAVLMPHHKGRKRLHLELKDNIARVGADITARVYQSLRSTWRTLQEFAAAHTASGATKNAQEEAEEEESEAIKRVFSRLADGIGGNSSSRSGDDSDDYDDDEDDVEKGTFPSQLNRGRRLDYVLQEGPLESLNDYLFALSSHAVYWDSQDCLLFMLNQIFNNAAVGTETSTPAVTPSMLTPRGSTTHDFTSATETTSLIQHSASIPVFSNVSTGSSALSSQAIKHLYPPSQTPLFNPSPAPSTVSLQSQCMEGGSNQATSEIGGNSRPTEGSKFVEIDLTP
ncbi:Phospholipase DDHD2 [Taenia crassiceps]|uniref:Phospholipase DDHD2 n=1 Tax=Taenia crassiceps TaxID=6207 RepID=A0ABR4QUC6_9CEST